MSHRLLPRITASALMIPIALTLLVTSSSYADENKQPNGSPSPSSTSEETVLGSSEASNNNWSGAVIKIRELKRSETGDYAQLIWTLDNKSSTYISLSYLQNETYNYLGTAEASGLVLLDESSGIRFHPYIDSAGECLCAGADYSNTKQFALITGPGAQNTYWASYRLPPEVDKVTIEIPGFLPIKDVPVS